MLRKNERYDYRALAQKNGEIFGLKPWL